MDAMAVAIHIKYLVGQNEHLTFYSPQLISCELAVPEAGCLDPGLQCSVSYRNLIHMGRSVAHTEHTKRWFALLFFPFNGDFRQNIRCLFYLNTTYIPHASNWHPLSGRKVKGHRGEKNEHTDFRCRRLPASWYEILRSLGSWAWPSPVRRALTWWRLRAGVLVTPASSSQTAAASAASTSRSNRLLYAT